MDNTEGPNQTQEHWKNEWAESHTYTRHIFHRIVLFFYKQNKNIYHQNNVIL